MNAEGMPSGGEEVPPPDGAPFAGNETDETTPPESEETSGAPPMTRAEIPGVKVGTNNGGQIVSADTINGGITLEQRADYGEYLGEVATRRLRHAAGIGTDRIRDIRLTFHPAEPDHYEEFLDGLDRHRLGLITGVPGNGRTCTAIHALTEPSPRRVSAVEQSHEPGGTRVDQVVVDPHAPDAGLAGIVLDSDHPRLLDLTHLPDPEPSHLAAVRALIEEVHSSQIRLVVIAHPGGWEDELVACRARLRVNSLPRPEHVFREAMRRLHQERRFVEAWTQNPRVRELLAGGNVLRSVRFVRAVDRAEPLEKAITVEDHQAWADRALKAFTESGTALPGWSPSSLDDEEARRTEFRRVLIQTVALLEGASSADIVTQSRALAELWSVSLPHATPVSGGGFTRLLELIGARVVSDRVRYERRDHAEDALDHLWREHPEARGTYQEWAGDAVARLSKGGRVAVARRWLDLARRHRDPSPVLAMLRFWYRRPGLMWAAVPVVAEAAVSVEIGDAVRGELYRIATSGQPASRHLMVVEVCRIYGRVQPGMSLTRLRHLADRVPEAWVENLETAVWEIALQPGNLQTALDVLPDWLEEGETASGVSTRVLSLLLGSPAGPELDPPDLPDLPELLDQRELAHESIALVWLALHKANTEIMRLLWYGLEVIATRFERGRAHEGVLRCLVLAAAESMPFAETLHGATRRWSVSHTRSSPPVEELRRALAESLEMSGTSGTREDTG